MLPTIRKKLRDVLAEPEITLPVGYLDSQGTLHQTFELVDQTGAVDEAISDPKVRANGGKIITAALEELMSNLGTIKKPKKEQIRAMASADRDFLLLMNYHQSIAEDENICWDESCPFCKKKFSVEINYLDLDVNYLDQSQVKHPVRYPVELLSGIKKSGEVYKELLLSLPTGEAQEKLASVARENAGQAVTQLLALVTEEVKGLDNWSYDTFKEMQKRDRVQISKALNEVKLGVDMNTNVECANCAATYTTGIPFQTLLGE